MVTVISTARPVYGQKFTDSINLDWGGKPFGRPPEADMRQRSGSTSRLMAAVHAATLMAAI
jgi:hypothetical protein